MEDQSTPFTVRPAASKDADQVVDLFARSFGRAMTTNHWRWKLRACRALGSTTDKLDNVWLALDENDEPVFQYAGIPLRYQLESDVVTGVVSVDTMTAPEHRRRGLLSQIGKLAYDHWQSAGAAFVIGLPNERWGSRATALGWEKLFALQWLQLLLQPQALLWRRAGLRPPSLRPMDSFWYWRTSRWLNQDPSIEVNETKGASSFFDDLWAVCSRDREFSLIRDRRWIEWRFINAPHDYEVLIAARSGTPVGYLVYRQVDSQRSRGALLVDALFSRRERQAFATLLSHLLRRLKSNGVETVSALTVPGSQLHQLLRQAHFRAGRSFSVEIRPFSVDLPMERMRQPELWHMTGADYDVV